MFVSLSRRMPSRRISVLAALFLFSISFASRLLPTAYAQVPDLYINDGADIDVPAEEPADTGAGPAARPRPTPFIPNLAATWNGSITGSAFGAGTVQFVITQRTRTLRGTFQQNFPNGNPTSVVGRFAGALAVNNSIRMTLASTSLRGCAEKATLQLINQFEFSGSYTGSKKCLFDHGTLDVISSLAPTPTPTATATTTPTQTPTPTATATPLEFESPEVIPLPPLTVNPPQPASLTPATVSVNFPGATNIMLSVSGDGCGSLTGQTVSGSQLSETQPVGQFGTCNLVAQVPDPERSANLAKRVYR